MLSDNFINRHIGISAEDEKEMLKTVGVSSIEELINQTIPESIRLNKDEELKLTEEPLSEYELFLRMQKFAKKNKIFKTFIGMGYYGTMMPPVIQRNVLENPSWYTSYTPYQAEISQGRLEAMLNFQTAITELTGMEVANASLLDEGTAAAEAMAMAFNLRSPKLKKANANKFFVDKNIFPQTIEVIKTRSEPYGIVVEIGDFSRFTPSEEYFAAIVQYPDSNGEIIDYQDFAEKIHSNEALFIVAADILSLAILKPPAEFGADIVVGSSQRLGLSMAFGGPHAGYFATKMKYIRKMPGRIIGVSRDKYGRIAYRMTLQTREQHIKRERATSNICTAQALLAVLSGFYAVYHGKEGLQKIALDIHYKATLLDKELQKLGYKQLNKNFFDTLKIQLPDNIKASEIEKIAHDKKLNFRIIDEKHIGISLDETTRTKDLNKILKVFAKALKKDYDKIESIPEQISFDKKFLRTGDFMQQEVFKKYRTETELMRYIKRLERKDISLTHSMIPLGSCTMKLNSAVSMFALSNPHFTDIHPFVPQWQAKGYIKMIEDLKENLKAITGMDDVCFQPNSGAAGEYTGMLLIREYHKRNGQPERNVMLIPASAHGTNPASARMAGMKIVVIKTDENGNIDFDDLKQKAEENKDNLAGFMVTYPSTHGVFESKIKEMCDIIHRNGGLVYMDGANLNAQIGYTNPAKIGADVCHLNLHKTFGIPHGGGGPGVGPVAVTKKLAGLLPTHPVIKNRENGIGAVASAPYGSALILTISYAYVKMLGAKGLKRATEIAILNANYIASALKDHYKILYTGETGRVAHELIIDLRKFKHELNITEIDVAKRLIDYGFHAPTVSFPVVGTLMIEPTESESKAELDKFISTLINIRKEIQEVQDGKADKDDNVLKNAPHPEYEIVSDNWNHNYSRTKAAYPLDFVRENKFWINVARIDEAYGDRNIYCKVVTDEYFKLFPQKK